MSSLKILPSQLTYEELLEAMADAPEDSDEVLEHTDDLVPFLSHYGVQPGDHLVSKVLLYKLYKTFSKHPIDASSFSYRVGEFVASKYAGGKPFFCLNQDNFAISTQIFKQEKTIEKTKSATYQKHFAWFLKGQNIAKGSKWVEGFILFYIYKTHCQTHRVRAKLGYENFHKFLKLHFKFKRLKGNRALWFQVNTETYDLIPQEEQDVIRNARKNSKKARGSSKEVQQSQADTEQTE